MADLRIGSAAELKSDRVVTMTPQEYLGVIHGLGVFSFRDDAETEAEAIAGISECQRLRHVVRQAKKAITLDLEGIRAHHQQLESACSGRRLFGLTLTRPVGGVAKSRIRQRMLKMMRPYESIIRQLDEILDRVDDSQHRLRGLIGE
jgi:hypothetical protein